MLHGRFLQERREMDRLLFVLFLFSGHMLFSFAYECDTGELRLVNGSSSNSGRVEFCRSGVWGTVSDIQFDINDAKVVCRKLGYDPDGDGLSYTGSAAYGEGTGQVNIGYLYCQGSEESLLSCQYNNTWIGTDHTRDVGVTCPLSSCTQGSLRLIGGFKQTEGTLEVCNNGSWNIICADQFQRQDGFVACRQLGYPATATQVITSYRFSNGHGSPTWTQFQCVGNESRLEDCYYNTGVCQGYNTYTANFAIVGLKCEGDVIPPNNCAENSIRLNGPNGINTEEGRIELCSNGVWGTVGSTNFGYKDGRAACRQLQYGAPGVRVYPPSYFGDGSGPILMTDLSCLGSEYNLYQCNRPFTSHTESHSNDATIKCWRKVGVTCTDYDVRFQNGSNNYGRLEVCLFQEWGSICDDGWDRNDARTICRQRNFNPSYASFYINSAFGDGDKIPVKFTRIACTGSESTLSLCGKNDQIETNCNFGHTVGVRCFSPDGCTDGDVRLWGGQSEREGEVQVCKDGVWGYICSDTWNDVNAKTVCKQLQFSDTWSAYSTTGLFGGSQDQRPLIYDGATCTGSETTLTSCTLADYATVNPTCTTIAGVMCAEAGTTCTEWDVRLMGGSSSDGRVEICRTNTWTTVDAVGWDYNDAMVVCRQRGFNDTWAVALIDSQFGSGNRRIAHNNFQCSGTESAVQSCTSSVYAANTLMENWYNHNRAGVSCRMRNQAETCSVEGSVRLSDGATAREGRVEVCRGGYWGSVCSIGWSRLNSLVACRSAGFETLRPMTTQSAYSGAGQGPVNLAYVSCLGNEASLSDCPSYSGIGVPNCYHGNDVGIKCPETPASYYNVSVTSSPSSYDIPIGTQVQLSCVSDPAPPSGVTYEWKTTITEDPLTQSSPSSPDATVTITHRHPKVSHYYCAMKWGNEVLGIGSTTLTIQNILVPVQSTYTGSVGGSVTLSVTQTQSMALGYFRNLQWYFSGKPVQSALSDYSISSDGLSLTLSNLAELRSGYYTLQYDGLYLYQYDLLCEQETLNFIREYPLLSPAVMKLEVGSVSVPDRSQGLPDSVLYPDTSLTSYKKGTQYLSLVTHTLVPTFSSLTSLQWHEFSFASFSSGNASKLYSATGLLSPLSDPHYELQFLRPTLLQTGYYETQFTTEPSTILNFIGCSITHGYSYADFINTQLGFSSPLVIGSAKQSIGYYETPSAQVAASTTAFTNESNATITCSSLGGYPLYYNLSIVKNGVSVANSIGSPEIMYTTQDDVTVKKYGSYWCVVNNLYDSNYTTVLLRETASLKLSLDVSSCNMWSNDTRDVFGDPILNLLEDICNCTLSNSVITVDSLVCSTDIEEMTSEVNVTSSLTYSSSDGNQTSSTIYQMLYAILNRGTSLSLRVSNQTLAIKWPLDEPDNPFTLPDEALLAILFVSGFIASTLIFTIAIVIAFCVQKRKRKRAAQRAAPPVAFHTRHEEARIEEQPNTDGDRSPLADNATNEDDEDEDWEFPSEK